MDVNNTERPNDLEVVSNGSSLKGWTALHRILRDYIKTEAMPQKKGKKKKKAMESTSCKKSQEKEQYKLLREKAWIKLSPSPFKAVAWNQI